MSTEVPISTESIQQEIKTSRFGNLVILSYTSGPKIDNDTITNRLRKFTDSQEDIDEAIKVITNSGINTRRQNFSSETPKEEVLKVSAEIGGALIRSAMESHGWDSIDYFVDTSASLNTTVRALTLENAGIDPETVTTKSYRIACAGAVTAFVDALANPNLKNKRVVICALEPLSQHIAPDQYRTASINVPAIFGDDFSAIALNTSDYDLISAETYVKGDGGTIRFNVDYDLNSSDPSLVPEHYILEEQGKQILFVTNDGIFVTIQPPEGDMPSEMNGYKTFKFFIPHTCNVLERVVKKASEMGVNPTQVIMHQPSQKVNEGIQNKAGKSPVLKNLQIPDFVLGKIGRSNSSSATILVVMQCLIKEKMLDPSKPFVFVSLGIGGVITAAVVRSTN